MAPTSGASTVGDDNSAPTSDPVKDLKAKRSVDAETLKRMREQNMGDASEAQFEALLIP